MLFFQILPKCHLDSESPRTKREFNASNLQESGVHPGTEVTPDRGICRRFWAEAEVTEQGQQQPHAQPPGYSTDSCAKARTENFLPYLLLISNYLLRPGKGKNWSASPGVLYLQINDRLQTCYCPQQLSFKKMLKYFFLSLKKVHAHEPWTLYHWLCTWLQIKEKGCICAFHNLKLLLKSINKSKKKCQTDFLSLSACSRIFSPVIYKGEKMSPSPKRSH